MISLKLKHLGLPYLGSKRRLASEIVDIMLSRHLNARYLYDLFGGGGAISLEAIQRPQFDKVIYNDKNTGIVEVLKDILYNGISRKYYQWVDRKTFEEHKYDNDWFGGLLQVVWSFNNNQQAYQYGRKIESLKYLLHQIIVYRDIEALRELHYKYRLYITMPRSDPSLDWREQITQRRIRVSREITQIEKDIKPEPLAQTGRKRFNNIEHLERIDRIRKIYQLPTIYKEKLIIYNRSYDEVEINTPPEETVIYLDPPYVNKHYQIGIDKNELLKWIKHMSQKGYPIYVSEYEFDGLECVWERLKTNRYSRSKRKVYERLFSNHNLL